MAHDELLALSRLAAANGGVISAGALRAEGISPNVTARMVRRGLITREFRGFYRLGYERPGEIELWRLARAATEGCLSHASAARYWGYSELPAAPVHVTVQRQRKTPRAPWLVVHSAVEVPPVVTRDGLRITTALRTSLDLAGQDLAAEHLLPFVDHCIARRLLTVAQLDRYVRSHGANAGGVARLRRYLQATADTDSRAEAELVRLLVAHGLDRPATRHVVRRNGHFLARVDLAWPAARVALELDGFAFHSGHRTFVADRERGNRLVAAGWSLLRTTPASMRNDPAALCEAVQAAIDRARIA